MVLAFLFKLCRAAYVVYARRLPSVGAVLNPGRSSSQERRTADCSNRPSDSNDRVDGCGYKVESLSVFNECLSVFSGKSLGVICVH